MQPFVRAFMRTPVGYLEVVASARGIRSLTFLPFRVRIHQVPHPLKSCIAQLEEYFSGTRRVFELDYDLTGSAFQLKVWKELMNIPYGETITYHELARRIGNENAFRAAGGANSRNPIALIVPCHRVIGANGRLIGYRGGLKRKKWLLEHEHAFAQRDLFYGKL